MSRKFVLKEQESREYYLGTTYIVQGEVYPSITSDVNKAKIYKTQATAYKGMDALNKKCGYSTFEVVPLDYIISNLPMKNREDGNIEAIRYVIEYEHLADELITNENAKWHFNEVKNNANKYKLELTDEDFKRLFNLSRADKEVDWIMHKMSAYKLTLIDALVTYITS